MGEYKKGVYVGCAIANAVWLVVSVLFLVFSR